MSGPLARGVRRLLGMRVCCALLLCVLTGWFTSMVGTFRCPGIAQTLGVLLGLALLAASLLRFVQRLRTTPHPPWLHPVLAHADRLVLLLVINLMLLTLLPGVPLLAFTPLGSLVARLGLPLVAQVSAQALFGLFAAGVILVACLLVLVAGEALARRAAWIRWTVGVADRAVLVAIVAYLLYGVALAYNGSLDASPPVEHRSRIVSASGLGWVRWVDVESWRRPGTTERVLIFVEVDRDDLWSGRAVPGQPIRVTLHAGRFGLPWVEKMRVDEDRDLEGLVAAAPSAAIPRKRLVEALLRERRWEEALTHARAYVTHYPRDHTFMFTVASSLRAAGRLEDAATIDPHAAGGAPRGGRS